MNTYKLTHKNLMDIIDRCGGDIDILPDVLNAMKKQKITCIEDLIEYPFKKNYMWIIREDKAPLFHQFFCEYMFKEWDCFERHEKVTLQWILDSFNEPDWDEDMYKAFKCTKYFENLFETKFPDDERDPRELEITDENLQIVLNHIRNAICDELVDLKFGSMCYDW